MTKSNEKARSMPDQTYPPQHSVKVALTNACPRCGKGKMFTGFLTIPPACTACGLDYSFADAGDGPVVFIIMIVGFIVVGLGLYVEVNYQPPYWVHALIWAPLTIGLGLGLMRPFKGWLIAQQFKHKAREGRLHDAED